MMSSNVSSIGNQMALLNTSASNIAKAGVGEKYVDLAKEFTDQIKIEDGVKANAVAIKTEDEMSKTLLDIKV